MFGLEASHDKQRKSNEGQFAGEGEQAFLTKPLVKNPGIQLVLVKS
jgi:hypothetical protein